MRPRDGGNGCGEVRRRTVMTNVPRPGGFRRIPFTADRRVVADAGWLGTGRPTLHALAEADVTEVRRWIRAHRDRTGERLSFSAYVTHVLGGVVAEDLGVQAYRSWRGDLVVFEDVDVLMMVEVERDGAPFPQPHIARGVNRRSWRELSAEIRDVQAAPRSHEGAKSLESLTRIPWPIRRAGQLLMLRSPHLMKKYAGTVGLTSIGVRGAGATWGVGLPIHSLAVVLGGIAEKPVVVDGEVVVREVLSLTVSFNHDIVDGAPAARFLRWLIAAIESGAPRDLPTRPASLSRAHPVD